ncbi:MAG: DUF1343 domain-containing protein, partial [Vitreoscilla sp.]|nr:DUF1343 domain-containing protein [Vitreoscilla sp.]
MEPGDLARHWRRAVGEHLAADAERLGGGVQAAHLAADAVAGRGRFGFDAARCIHPGDWIVDREHLHHAAHRHRSLATVQAVIEDGKDAKTGLPVYSLYGKNRKPSPEQLAGLDALVFDI